MSEPATPVVEKQSEVKQLRIANYRYIIYYENAKTKQWLLDQAKERGDEVLYQYKNFQAITIKVQSCLSKEQAMQTYGNHSGIVRMVEDGIMDLH